MNGLNCSPRELLCYRKKDNKPYRCKKDEAMKDLLETQSCCLHETGPADTGSCSSCCGSAPFSWVKTGSQLPGTSQYGNFDMLRGQCVRTTGRGEVFAIPTSLIANNKNGSWG